MTANRIAALRSYMQHGYQYEARWTQVQTHIYAIRKLQAIRDVLSTQSVSAAVPGLDKLRRQADKLLIELAWSVWGCEHTINLARQRIVTDLYKELSELDRAWNNPSRYNKAPYQTLGRGLARAHVCRGTCLTVMAAEAMRTDRCDRWDATLGGLYDYATAVIYRGELAIEDQFDAQGSTPSTGNRQRYVEEHLGNAKLSYPLAEGVMYKLYTNKMFKEAAKFFGTNYVAMPSLPHRSFFVDFQRARGIEKTVKGSNWLTHRQLERYRDTSIRIIGPHSRRTPVPEPHFEIITEEHSGTDDSPEWSTTDQDEGDEGDEGQPGDSDSDGNNNNNNAGSDDDDNVSCPSYDPDYVKEESRPQLNPANLVINPRARRPSRTVGRMRTRVTKSPPSRDKPPTKRAKKVVRHLTMVPSYTNDPASSSDDDGDMSLGQALDESREFLQQAREDRPDNLSTPPTLVKRRDTPALGPKPKPNAPRALGLVPRKLSDESEEHDDAANAGGAAQGQQPEEGQPNSDAQDKDAQDQAAQAEGVQAGAEQEQAGSQAGASWSQAGASWSQARASWSRAGARRSPASPRSSRTGLE